MIKVAVTGNIGSGKTEFIKFISNLKKNYSNYYFQNY